jgi:hypothetical protein
MIGTQIPAWVTIGLGVLVVLGTLGGLWGGQTIAARRDDKRWDREVRREEERWQREREKEADARNHELAVRLYDQKVEVYTEFLGFLYRWYEAARPMLEARYAGDTPPREAREKLRECILQYDYFNVRLGMLASAEMQEKARDSLGEFYRQSQFIIDENIFRSVVKIENVTIEGVKARLLNCIADLCAKAQAEVNNVNGLALSSAE